MTPGGRPGARWPAVAGALVAGLVAVLATYAATGGPAPVISGVPTSGPLVAWALPVFRYGTDVAAAVTVGLILLAVALLPVRGPRLGPASYVSLQRASAAAATWAALALGTALLTVADIIGKPLGATLQPEVLRAFLLAFPRPGAYLLVAGAAGILAIALRITTSSSVAAVLLAVSFVVLVPPLVTGHASVAASHDMATSAAILHGVAVAPWVGGLLALCWAFRRRVPGRGLAVRRFSGLAGWCFVVVALGGVLSAVVRLTSPEDLFTTAYGRIVLLKVVALGGLGTFGAYQRRRSVPGFVGAPDGNGSAAADRGFARLAAGEAIVMTTAMGLAAVLSVTAPPVPADADALTGTGELLGYLLAPHPSLVDLVTTWRVDPLVAVLLGAAAWAYVTGVLRLRRAGIAWGVGRTVSWFVGLALILVATCSGIGAYGPALFSVHMVQHMTMAMFAPIALVLGAPVTLALRALPTARRDTSSSEPIRGAREWILVALHSPVARFLTHPLVAFVIFVSSTYLVYFTGLYEFALRNHWAHLAMYGHFLFGGLLFSYVVIGVDPSPRRLPYWQRIVMLLATTPFHAFFAIAVMSSSQVIAETWFQGLGWLTQRELLADQNLGGGIAWAVGELVVLVMAAAIFVQWVRADEREARRSDRAADRAAARPPTIGGPREQADPVGTPGDELAQYNAMLARLAAQDRGEPR